MAVFDVLNNKFDAGDRLSFVVNNAADEVAIRTLTTSKDMENGNAKTVFAYGDNILLKKIKVILPYQYVHSTDDIAITLNWLQNGFPGNIPELGATGTIHLPKCGELDVDIRLQAPDNVGGGTFEIQLVSLVEKVSMIYSPASLDATIQDAIVQLDIIHTIDMS